MPRVDTLLPVGILYHPVQDGLIPWVTLTVPHRVPVGKRPFGGSRGRLGMAVRREAYEITTGLPRDYHGMILHGITTGGACQYYAETFRGINSQG